MGINLADESFRERAENPSSVNLFFFDREINADRGSLEVEPKGGTVDMMWTSASADPRHYLFFSRVWGGAVYY
jgi:hypothetical protein